MSKQHGWAESYRGFVITHSWAFCQMSVYRNGVHIGTFGHIDAAKAAIDRLS